MIKDFERIKKQLLELASVVNAFKSEVVQVRLLELLFRGTSLHFEHEEEPQAKKEKGVGARKRRKGRVRIADERKEGKPPRTTGRAGGPGTLTRLVNDGFFSKAKTIKDIVDHCKNNLASVYKQSDFSGALARYVREGKLKRKKNQDNQYEYTKA